MKHIMVDMEFLSFKYPTPIISIGAVYFDAHGAPFEKDMVHGNQFYEVIDWSSVAHHGATPDVDTLLWFLKQLDGVQEAARVSLKNLGRPISEVLNLLSEFIMYKTNGDPFCIWSNGADCDIARLEQWYRLLEIKVPWYYKNVRCYRTVKAIADTLTSEKSWPVPDDMQHNALSDALYQARAVCFWRTSMNELANILE